MSRNIVVVAMEPETSMARRTRMSSSSTGRCPHRTNRSRTITPASEPWVRESALSAIGKWWTTRGLAFGYGFSDNIADVYSFLMREFRSDDRIFIFGFSRGAYTARALCGFAHVWFADPGK